MAKKADKSLWQKLFPVAKQEDFYGVIWPDHIAKLIKEIEGEFSEFNAQVPPYVLKRCLDSKDLSVSEFNEHTLPQIRMSVHMAIMELKPKEKEPMPEDVKQYLRDIAESKKAKAKDVKEPVKDTPADKKAPGRVPVFQDPKKQEELIKKYPWAVPGTFVQDKDKPNGTNVNIKCVICGSQARQVHLADLFQAKKCLKCR